MYCQCNIFLYTIIIYVPSFSKEILLPPHIFYCNSSKSTKKETGKTHLCAVWLVLVSNYDFFFYSIINHLPSFSKEMYLFFSLISCNGIVSILLLLNITLQTLKTKFIEKSSKIFSTNLEWP